MADQSRSAYQVVEVSVADTHRLFGFMLEGVFGTDFNLKGFEYPWILKARQWRPGERVLDVGAGYSPLPQAIAEAHGCEVWAVDDFGLQSGEPFWTRGKNPEEFVRSQTGVRYVLERLGDPATSSLPAGAFDVIYSASSLEHVPHRAMEAVWRHMDLLLKPGGEMLHAVDLKVQADRGLRYLLAAEWFDLVFPLLPWHRQVRYARATPMAYYRFVARTLGVKQSVSLRHLGVTRLLLDPEVLVESPRATYNRIVKDGLVNMRYRRRIALLLHLRKEDNSRKEDRDAGNPDR